MVVQLHVFSALLPSGRIGDDDDEESGFDDDLAEEILADYVTGAAWFSISLPCAECNRDKESCTLLFCCMFSRQNQLKELARLPAWCAKFARTEPSNLTWDTLVLIISLCGLYRPSL